MIEEAGLPDQKRGVTLENTALLLREREREREAKRNQGLGSSISIDSLVVWFGNACSTLDLSVCL